MQGQRNSSEPFYEIEFDQASNSRNSPMDQQMYWNNPLYNSEENLDLPSSQLSPNGTNNSCRNVASQESVSLRIWDSHELNSSTTPLNEGSHDPLKLVCGQAPSSSIGNRSSGPRIRDTRAQANNTLSFGNENTQRNNNHISNGESFSQFLNFGGAPRNSADNLDNVGMSNQVLQSGLRQELYNPGSLQRQHIPLSTSSSETFENSSRAIDFFSKIGGRGQGVPLDIPCSSHNKRKNIEGILGESSASASASNHNQGISQVDDDLNTRIGTITRVAPSENLHFGHAAGNDESSQRNTRKRITLADPANTHTPIQWSQHNSVTHCNIQPAHLLSSSAVPSSQLPDPTLMGSNVVPNRQCAARTIPMLSPDLFPFPHIGTSTTEAGSSSGSPAFAVDGESVELNTVSDASNMSDQVFVPPQNTRNSGWVQSSWGLENRSTILSGNAVPAPQLGTDIRVRQSQGANWVSQQHRRRLSEALRRSFVPSGSEHRSRFMSLPLRYAHSSTSQEVGRHQSGAVSHGHPYMRPPNILPRQNNGASGIPLSMWTLAAAREGRSRFSEIHNVFDLIRRRDGMLLPDSAIFEQSVLAGGGNFQDRYRDMRLDVDNMSYEELLALGERIGSVNTGLSEEKILNSLQQRTYVSITSEPSDEVEPCCICREEYAEGDELGRLDCGHNFHTACIKQWLRIKNLCPICKTTALSE
ncbi:putative E3 ubiquitin-protein ligase HIP1 [Canna indica]|uniref:RING-type E3 ubiquitin transferase n=1 Tax=Canna indica TaxID=4628 RepID=A0AAQ3JPA1_9LILI|nr:putative E3 ubiquitin-protein ligase HIP1 [Canna indica]